MCFILEFSKTNEKLIITIRQFVKMYVDNLEKYILDLVFIQF